jgi:lipopolysaccharide export system permease protein
VSLGESILHDCFLWSAKTVILTILGAVYYFIHVKADLIFRYLAKEVFITLVALTTILLLIFMSNQFVQYLTRAANGQIPVMFIVKLMMLELPTLMGLLLPLGFYLALLLAYGRMYADSEMTVLHACGYGPRQLLKHSLMMASLVACVVFVIVWWAGPKIAIERTTLLRTSGVQLLIKTIVPGHFRSLPGGHDVFYVETMSHDHARARGVFLARLTPKEGIDQWNVLWSEEAYAKTDPLTHEEYVVFQAGKAYQGTPGKADYQVASFGRYDVRLPHPVVTFKPDDLRTVSSNKLWPLSQADPLRSAELQWRLSVPLMVMVLTLVAVPLSRVNPRVGKYANLLPAIVILLVYANFMFVTRGWLAAGKIPVWLGMWWLHGLIALIGLLLFWRNRVRLA